MTRAILSRSSFLCGLVVLACSSCFQGKGTFAEPCVADKECANKFCVAGETGSRGYFCSESCAGRPTGTVCGGGLGRCIADFASWCWRPCETDADCGIEHAYRSRCGDYRYYGAAEIPFKVCLYEAPPE